jgi:CubicO group peptidase (beta-lactamase class C family)
MVVRRGRLVEFDKVGWADREAHVPMRSHAIFRIASMSKPITSVAAMILIEEGKLLLGDPVSKDLPAFRNEVSTRCNGSWLLEASGTETLASAPQPLREPIMGVGIVVEPRRHLAEAGAAIQRDRLAERLVRLEA